MATVIYDHCVVVVFHSPLNCFFLVVLVYVIV